MAHAGGRPLKLKADEATLKIVKGLGNIQATGKECAAVLGVTEPTWLKFKKDHPSVENAFRDGIGNGLASLRRRQFEAAQAGNATMLIWLGKQYLDQRDQQQTIHTGPNGGPIKTVDLTNMSDDDLNRLEAIFGPLAGGAGSDAEPDQGGESAA